MRQTFVLGTASLFLSAACGSGRTASSLAYVANNDVNSVSVFQVDAQTGMLSLSRTADTAPGGATYCESILRDASSSSAANSRTSFGVRHRCGRSSHGDRRLDDADRIEPAQPLARPRWPLPLRRQHQLRQRLGIRGRPRRRPDGDCRLALRDRAYALRRQGRGLGEVRLRGQSRHRGHLRLRGGCPHRRAHSHSQPALRRRLPRPALRSPRRRVLARQ